MSDTANRGWQVEPSEREGAVRIIQGGLTGDALPMGVAAVEVVSAFGRLRRMRQAAELARLRALVRDHVGLVAAALAAFDFLALEAAALDFGTAVRDLVQDGPRAEQARGQVLAALAKRDRADLLLTGGDSLLGRGPELDRESRLALSAFDGVVEPLLFHAVPLNTARQAALAQVAPAERARLWWYARGVELSPESLEALALAAELIHCFPAAAAELEELRRAEDLLTGLSRMGAAARGQAEATEVAVAASASGRATEARRMRVGRSSSPGSGRGGQSR
jgi:hypothetical protein